ncbi:MAG: response regulator [Methanobacteriota archaeon]
MNEERKRKDGEEIHILCIEDNDDDYEIIKRSLEKNIKNPLLVERASTWREGLNLMHSTAFDVLLLDYLLPDMNGLEILERIKKENVEIPIIMLTGGGDENIAVKAMKEGVSDYIIKDDLETEKLSESITRVIALTRFLKQWDTGFPELHGLSKRRDTLTIIANTLSASVNGISKTRLVYKTNLNFKSIKKYLVFLLTNSFLSVHTDDGKEVYKTTEKGLRLLKQLRDIKEYFG